MDAVYQFPERPRLRVVSRATDVLERSIFAKVAERSDVRLHLRRLLAQWVHEMKFPALTLDERTDLAEGADFLWAGLLEVLEGKRTLGPTERTALLLPEEAHELWSGRR